MESLYLAIFAKITRYLRSTQPIGRLVLSASLPHLCRNAVLKVGIMRALEIDNFGIEIIEFLM